MVEVFFFSFYESLFWLDRDWFRTVVKLYKNNWLIFYITIDNDNSYWWNRFFRFNCTFTCVNSLFSFLWKCFISSPSIQLHKFVKLRLITNPRDTKFVRFFYLTNMQQRIFNFCNIRLSTKFATIKLSTAA